MADFKMNRKGSLSAKSGLKSIDLRQNQLSDGFGECLQGCLRFDKYMEAIDLSHNNMSKSCLINIVQLALRENNSLISIDLRFNLGSTSPIMKQVALCMLKNISQIIKK